MEAKALLIDERRATRQAQRKALFRYGQRRDMLGQLFGRGAVNVVNPVQANRSPPLGSAVADAQG